MTGGDGVITYKEIMEAIDIDSKFEGPSQSLVLDRDSLDGNLVTLIEDQSKRNKI